MAHSSLMSASVQGSRCRAAVSSNSLLVRIPLTRYLARGSRSRAAGAAHATLTTSLLTALPSEVTASHVDECDRSVASAPALLRAAELACTGAGGRRDRRQPGRRPASGDPDRHRKVLRDRERRT